MNRILLIEDVAIERELRERLYQMCRKSFHGEVEFCSEPGWPQGLAVIQSKPVDVVLLDLVLPPMGRDETLKALEETNNLPPVIILTGVEEPFLREKCIGSGADAVISKLDANHYPEHVCRECYEAFLRRQRDLRHGHAA